MNRTTRTRAFALVTTVLILALAAVVTARLTMRAHEETRATIESRHELAWRWLQRSAEANLLPQARDRLIEAGEGQGVSQDQPPTGRVQAAFLLDGGELLVRLDDESSKAHPHTFFVRHLDELANRLARVLPDHDIQLRPGRSLQAQDEEHMLTGLTYQQIVRHADLEQVWGSDSTPGVSDRLTVFGNGRANLRTIDPTLLHEVLKPSLTIEDAETLCRLVRDKPALDVDAALASLGLSRRQQQRVADVLVDSPDTYGVWLRWSPPSGQPRGLATVRSTSDEVSENVRRLIW